MKMIGTISELNSAPSSGVSAPAAQVLVASADARFREKLSSLLVDWGYEVLPAQSTDRMFEALTCAAPSVIIVDVDEDMFNDDVLVQLKRKHPKIAVIVSDRDLSVDSAVQYVKMGISDVVPNPAMPINLRLKVDGLNQVRQGELARHRIDHGARRGRGDFKILGESPAIIDILDLIDDVAATDATVLILGESGTGKELIASAIHQNSDRAEKDFVPVNVAALPPNIAESVLFGHEKGAYTGADSMAKGWCETADGGTLLLDEIGEMDILLQSKLLRFLQDGTFMRVGASKIVNSDVRIIAATNRDPEEMVSEQRLREDLYYRLNVFPIRLPSLRERREDIPILATRFLERSTEQYKRHIVGFTDAAMDCLMEYKWPGNIRQLENLVTRMVLLTRDPYIGINHVPPEIKGIARSNPRAENMTQMKHVEKEAIISALRQASGNAVAAAKILGVGQATIYRKIKRFGIELESIKSQAKVGP